MQEEEIHYLVLKQKLDRHLRHVRGFIQANTYIRLTALCPGLPG